MTPFRLGLIGADRIRRTHLRALAGSENESAQVLCRLSGGAAGFVSLGRRFPEGDVCWAQVFGARSSEECRFLWPPDAEKSFLPALRDQAESFARYAREQREGAQGDDAVAMLHAPHPAAPVLNDRTEIT